MDEKKPMPLSDKVGLPFFTYHPDPLATGSFEASETACVCCGRERGFLYMGPVYALEELHDQLCPWCIADGSAAARFNAEFSDGLPLVKAGVPGLVIEEVTRRTPGYISWQGDDWKCCCEDACEFHGDASREHLLALDASAVQEFMTLTQWSPEKWHAFIADVYEPGGNPAIYHFTCRSCNKHKHGLDYQ